jgi:hypothetical protein
MHDQLSPASVDNFWRRLFRERFRPAFWLPSRWKETHWSWRGTSSSKQMRGEPLQLAMDNGAKRALIPLENKRSFLEVTGDVVEHVDPIFFGDPKTAAFKALGLN